MTLIAGVFLELSTPKNMVTSKSKKPCFRDPSRENMANGSKHCCNLNDSDSTIVINNSEGNYVEKSRF